MAVKTEKAKKIETNNILNIKIDSLNNIFKKEIIRTKEDAKKEYLINRLGFQTGLVFTHFSNGRTKSPNKGINTFAFSVIANLSTIIDYVL